MAKPFLKKAPKRTIHLLNRPQGSPKLEREARKLELLAEEVVTLKQKLSKLLKRVKDNTYLWNKDIREMSIALADISESLPKKK